MAERDLTSKLYDALAAYPALTPISLRHAQIRQDLAEYLAAALAGLNAEVRTETLNEAIEAARSEYLTDNTGDPEDEAYDNAVSDVVAAIGALVEAAPAPPVPDNTTGDEGEYSLEYVKERCRILAASLRAVEAERDGLRKRAIRAVHKLKSPAPSGSQHYRSGWDDGLEAAIDAISSAAEGGDR